jgi:hypothetical protein
MRSAFRVFRLTAVTLAILVGSASVTRAQEPPPPNPTPPPNQAQAAETEDAAPPAGYVSAIEGAARLDREGEATDVDRGVPLVAGDRLRTDAGRVEITLTDGTRLHLDRYSEIELPSDLVVRLARGKLLITINAGAGDRVSVEAPGALARFDEDGQYRIAVGGEDAVEVELAVLRGSGEISSDAGAVRLGTGERSRVRDGQAPSRPDTVAATPTTLERWADELMSASWQNTTSQTYLPSELDPYASTFDRYGSWQTDVTYGHVWYPSVESDWRPYYNGRWDHMRGYGWTWIAGDPWGYPTHHYGRWQLSVRGAWFWVPARRWGPAWVYWATTPTYVGWCPLGWNGRPVVSVFAYGSAGRIYGRGRDPYRAWTVLPTGHFGRSPVPRYRIDRTILDREQPRFVMQHTQPGFAPPRSPYRRANSNQRADGLWGTGTSAPPRQPGVTDPRGTRSDAAARAPYGASYRRAPQSRDDTSSGNPGGWANYREYERRQREAASGSNDGDDRDRSRGDSRGNTGGWSNYREYERRQREAAGRSNDDGDRSRDRSTSPRSPGSYTRPTDPGPRPEAVRPNRGDSESGRSSPGYVSPPSAAPRSPGADRGGDRGGSSTPSGPRPSGGGSEARRGDGGGSRGGDNGGSRGGAAPRRRP